MYSGLPNFTYEHAGELGIKGSLQVKDDFVATFLQKTLPSNRLQKGEDSDLQHKFLMLDNVKKKKDQTSKQKHGTKKQKKLSAKEKRKLRVFEVEKEGQKYEDYLPMHELWLSYMRRTLGLDRSDKIDKKEAGQRLIKGDFHGSNLVVYKSLCSSYVGISGICLKETKNLFTLITKDNKIKSVPKEKSIFMVQIDDHIFTIHGNNFRVTAAKRSTHKFKLKGKVVI